MPFQPKLIYLARRRPELSREAFTARWRRHAELGMSRPRWINIARYVHVDGDRPRNDERGVLADHDAIGMIWHRSPAHRAAHLADTGSRIEMEADEAKTFAAPIATCCLVAREQVLQTPDPAARWKLTALLAAAEPRAAPPASRGHVRNHPLPPETSTSWKLAAAVIEEWWFADRSAALAAARDIALLAGATVVLGRETELYRAP